MMIRLILTICMMIGLAMPCAHAQEKVDVPFEIPAEFQEAWSHVQNGIDETCSMPKRPDLDPDIYYSDGRALKIGSPLSYLTIETKAQVKDSTYYVDYTITNPTDELIEKDIDYIDIGCRLFTAQDTHDVYQHYHSDMIRTLTIPPHSSRSFTIPLAIKTPFEIIHHINSIFYFTDNTNLFHTSRNLTEHLKVLMTPIVLPSGDVYLAMKNHHPTKTVTDIRDLALRISLKEKGSDIFAPGTDFYHINTAQLPLRLKPQETAFFRLPRTFDEINDKLAFSFAELNISIDGIKHSFFSSSSKYRSYIATIFDNRSVRYNNPSIFSKYGLNIVEASGTYEMDDTTLYGYLRIKNPYDVSIYFKIPRLSSSFTYYKADNTRSEYGYRITFPYAIAIGPQKEIFLSFSLPLPQDIDHTFRFTTQGLSAENVKKKRDLLYFKIPFVEEKLPVSQKVLYRPALKPQLTDWPD